MWKSSPKWMSMKTLIWQQTSNCTLHFASRSSLHWGGGVIFSIRRNVCRVNCWSEPRIEGWLRFLTKYWKGTFTSCCMQVQILILSTVHLSISTLFSSLQYLIRILVIHKFWICNKAVELQSAVYRLSAAFFFFRLQMRCR